MKPSEESLYDSVTAAATAPPSDTSNGNRRDADIQGLGHKAGRSGTTSVLRGV